ncbi:DNA-3-methyladenine glycosylase [Microlunatus elymi]|uniref:Putative 3-methyladenine DNA glycosylase n=1 Tax=Microlunatus elymi TaxID=2596828 RepID=A0A516PTR8_9ACTN|nr:DNA-3-methyladenine glycosylase [Microlunatus elymi]QDP94584.1 DNA-3-methyladenine glycosylase [Microlunatus elymi]
MRTELAGDVTVAARTLLGATLQRGEVAVRIVEVEAYDGPTDPAAHTYNGKTDRNWVMFGPAGHLYVYFNYGMHHAANVSAGPDGRGSGVLLRAGEVIRGIDLARQRRGPAVVDRDLARGPGRLTQALGITRADNGTDLLATDPATDAVRLLPRATPPPKINTGPRVGISKEMERPWRFWIADDQHVSAYRRHTPRKRRGVDPVTD